MAGALSPTVAYLNAVAIVLLGVAVTFWKPRVRKIASGMTTRPRSAARKVTDRGIAAAESVDCSGSVAAKSVARLPYRSSATTVRANGASRTVSDG